MAGFGGVAEHIDEPQFATAVGLMLIDAQGSGRAHQAQKANGLNGKSAMKQATGFVTKFMSRFKA